MNREASKIPLLYYCFGGGLGHITRFRAFCHTQNIKSHLITNANINDVKLEKYAASVSVFPTELASDKNALRNWILKKISEINPEKLIIDAFPGGILGELCDLSELNELSVEYIARILKINVYTKRLNGTLPKFAKIWQVENLGAEHDKWLKQLAAVNGIDIERLELKYPQSEADSSIILPENCWLIVHSGSEEELRQLWEYANDTCMVEEVSPNFVVVGQCNKPAFIPDNVNFYNVYPVNILLNSAVKVISGAGFNMIHQMKNMRDKLLVLPFDRALDDQYLRLSYVGLAH